MLLVVFALILLGGWWYYDLQMAEIESLRVPGDAKADLEIAKMRLETVRATLTVAAGIGAASALVLSFRRQQHDEFHSTQQRITELRIQAVEQLSSDNATIRIGGLYNLERLGEQHEELRQLVLDEICSYLRRPFDLVTSPPADPEREVRAFAQEILQRRLKRRIGRRNYWSHNRLDLTDAALGVVDFSDCRLRNVNFTRVRFNGPAKFHGTSFEGPTSFTGVVFEQLVSFFDARFDDQVDFKEAAFSSVADLSRASFSGAAWFTKARFAHEVNCSLAEFREYLGFTGVAVDGYANCSGTVFHSYANFSKSVFAGGADFELARFAGVTIFEEVAFEAHADFETVSFGGWTSFARSTFRSSASFEHSVFKESTVFRESAWNWRASFLMVHFNATVDFEGSAFLDDVSLNGALLRQLLHDQSLPGRYRPVETSKGFRFLWTVKRDGSEPVVPQRRPGDAELQLRPGGPELRSGVESV
ncbi:hypothetical protein GALLR39Z86_07650 [Glycomyces algeriensis]|uniref:Pentapeptide repeat-containing protein n=1 Tax=Glycomyces algeriensis TaxID=256037 RepID=A0A9W6G5S2_9ACTN|nr:hypothetical protein GALLR39Z86_07650 [Glycomyces algeriensis]